MDFIMRNLEALGDEVAAALDDLADEVTGADGGMKRDGHIDGDDEDGASAYDGGDGRAAGSSSDGRRSAASTALDHGGPSDLGSDTASCNSADVVLPMQQQQQQGSITNTGRPCTPRGMSGDVPPPVPARRGQALSGLRRRKQGADDSAAIVRPSVPPPQSSTTSDGSPRHHQSAHPPSPPPSALAAGSPAEAPVPKSTAVRRPTRRPGSGILSSPARPPTAVTASIGTQSSPADQSDAEAPVPDTAVTTVSSPPPDAVHAVVAQGPASSPTARHPSSAPEACASRLAPPRPAGSGASSGFDLCDRDDASSPAEDGEFLVL